MSDYRQRFYLKYVSTFKNVQGNTEQGSSHSFRAYCDFKYAPYFRELKPEDAILEAGCGSGEMLEFLSGKGFRNLHGIDVSEEQIMIAVEKRLPAQQADVFAFLEHRRETFRAIVARDFVEHFTKEEVLRLFRLFFQALDGGGMLLLQTPNGQGLFSSQVIYSDLTHCTIFTPESLGQVLRLSGFEDIRFGETGPVPRNWNGRIRLLLWNGIKRAANFIRLVEAGKRQNIWTENVICVCRKPTPSGT